jgi:hypothetical protein
MVNSPKESGFQNPLPQMILLDQPSLKKPNPTNQSASTQNQNFPKKKPPKWDGSHTHYLVHDEF